MITIDLTPKMWVYHETKCPEGELFPEEEAKLLLRNKNGYVKSPNEFKGKVKDPKAKKEEVKEEIVTPDVSHETIAE